MARIERIELRMVNLVPKVKRTDAIQSFVSQETPIVVACVANSILCQIASMQSASSPIKSGTKWSDSNRMTEEPPVPIV